jgi:signal transduction histidine kinase
MLGGQVGRAHSREDKASEEERASVRPPGIRRSFDRLVMVGRGLEPLVAALRDAALDVVVGSGIVDAKTRLGSSSSSCAIVSIGNDPGICRTLRDVFGDGAIIAVVPDEQSPLAIECFAAGVDDVVSRVTPGPLFVARVRAQLRRQQAEADRARERDRKLALELTIAEARTAEAQTERERAETAYESLSADLEALSGAVAHDFRAPLRAIDGFARALEEDQGHLLEATGQHHLGRILAAGSRMNALLDDVSVLARIRRTPLNRSRVDLSELAQVVARTIQKSEPERSVVIDVEDGLVVDADASALRTVLDKLVGNAWKFTASCAHARISIGMSCEDQVRTFFVRDNGVGFDTSVADKLFRPFQRLHARSDFEGRGAGLATVRWIIARHGGRVWAESSPPGACFYFTL